MGRRPAVSDLHGADPSGSALPGISISATIRAKITLPTIRTKTPPSVDQLAREQLIGQGWEHFTHEERAIARWLRDHGAEVRSVNVSRIDGRRTPDAVLGAVTVEFKSLQRASATSIARNIRIARLQSRRLVIDGRKAQLDEEGAVDGLVQSFRRTGADLDEVVLLLEDGRGLHWP